MANDVLTPPPAPPVVAAPTRSDDIGFDRALAVSLARVPLIAVLWVLAAVAASAVAATVDWFGLGADANLGPVAVICAGMLLAAFIDGYYFKVPNWCTLSLVVSGWYIGALHDFGFTEIPGLLPGVAGGFGSAVAGTAIGFMLLFPALFIGGMGEGDVKMTMGFGSWLGAYMGVKLGAETLLWSFAVGVIIGGVFGLVIMALRRQVHTNASNFREIARDLQVLVTVGPGKAAERANSRRKDWVRLPYGVPLCAGFLGYLWYFFAN